MIRTWADDDARKLFELAPSRRIPANLQRVAIRKLRILDAAQQIDDLRVPPGNRLEKLRGNRAGHWSIRINDQWHVCFEWKGANAYDVEIVDYH